MFVIVPYLWNSYTVLLKLFWIVNLKSERQKKNYGLWQATGRKHYRRRKVIGKSTVSCEPSGLCCAIVPSSSRLVLSYLHFLLISACLVVHFILYFEDQLLSVRNGNNNLHLFSMCVLMNLSTVKTAVCLGYDTMLWWKCTDISEDCATAEFSRMSVHTTRPHLCHIQEVTAVRTWNVGYSWFVGIC